MMPMLPVQDPQQIVQMLISMFQTMDKETMISVGYACYLYILMDASNARSRARAARRRYYN
jgi:hypothetical protein